MLQTNLLWYNKDSSKKTKTPRLRRGVRFGYRSLNESLDDNQRCCADCRQKNRFADLKFKANLHGSHLLYSIFERRGGHPAPFAFSIAQNDIYRHFLACCKRIFCGIIKIVPRKPKRRVCGAAFGSNAGTQMSALTIINVTALIIAKRTASPSSSLKRIFMVLTSCIQFLKGAGATPAPFSFSIAECDGDFHVSQRSRLSRKASRRTISVGSPDCRHTIWGR